MTLGVLPKLSSEPPAELCQRRAISLDAPELGELARGCAPGEFLEQLIQREQFVAAVQYLAHGLPPRESVWWACVCARRALREDLPEEDLAALVAAEAWVYTPTEDGRRAAMAAAEKTGLASPGAFAAVACFFSGGNISPPGLPPLEPDEHLCPTMVASAVLSAAAVGRAERAGDRYRLLLDMGIDIARGGSGRKQE